MCLGCVYYAVFHVGSLGFSFHARVPLKCLFSYSSFNIKLTADLWHSNLFRSCNGKNACHSGSCKFPLDSSLCLVWKHHSVSEQNNCMVIMYIILQYSVLGFFECVCLEIPSEAVSIETLFGEGPAWNVFCALENKLLKHAVEQSRNVSLVCRSWIHRGMLF